MPTSSSSQNTAARNTETPPEFLLTDHCSLGTSSSRFQRFSVSDFQLLPTAIAITQMQSLLSASSIKRLK